MTSDYISSDNRWGLEFVLQYFPFFFRHLSIFYRSPLGRIGRRHRPWGDLFIGWRSIRNLEESKTNACKWYSCKFRVKFTHSFTEVSYSTEYSNWCCLFVWLYHYIKILHTKFCLISWNFRHSLGLNNLGLAWLKCSSLFIEFW